MIDSSQNVGRNNGIPEASGLKSRRESLRWLYSFLAPHRGAITLLLALSLVAVAISIAQPFLTKLIIDDGLLAKDFEALITWSCAMLVLGVFSLALSGVNRIRHTSLSGKILFALREDIFTHLFSIDPNYLTRQRSGDITSRIDRDVAEIQRFAVDTLFSSVSAIIGLIGTLAMMIWLNWQLTLSLLFLIPAELAYLAYMRPKVQVRNRVNREHAADISAFLVERIPALKFIKQSGTEEHEQGILKDLNQRYLGSFLSLQWTEFLTGSVPSLLITMTRAAVFLIGGYWVIEGQLALGTLVAFGTYIAMAIGPVQSLVGLYLAWQRLEVSLDRVMYIRDLPTYPERQSDSATALSSASAANSFSMNGKIEIRDLRFAYARLEDSTISANSTPRIEDEPHHHLLDGIGVTIEIGQKVAIIGENGAGKTTLIDLITGYLTPTSGEIFLDGRPQSATASKNWNNAFAVAQQHPVFFHASLRDNLCYGNDRVDADFLNRVLSITKLDALVDRLPRGLDTILYERGTNLSGGEQQRLSVARALIKRAPVLLLDEPIAAADPETGRDLIAAIDANFGGTTRIVISHRYDALMNADKCFELCGGTLQATEINTNT